MQTARSLAREGKHAEALDWHRWYHDHALAIDPGHYGVRLSFALGYWVELGRSYPPAREALVEIRAANLARIGRNEGSFQLVHDVLSMNTYLEEPEASVELFRMLHACQPQLAAMCYDLIEENLIAAGEFDLCVECR